MKRQCMCSFKIKLSKYAILLVRTNHLLVNLHKIFKTEILIINFL
jgi:hypothetical protein